MCSVCCNVDDCCLSCFFFKVNDLIAKILVVDPNKRLSLRGISEHPWMKFGQESVPRLEAIDLILSHNTDVELQWSALVMAMPKLDVVYTVPIDRMRQLEVHRMVCHYPTADMKFTVTLLRVSMNPSDPPFFEFVIRAGETSEFQNLVDQIQKTFKRSMLELTGFPSGSLSKAPLSDDTKKLIASDGLGSSSEANPSNVVGGLNMSAQGIHDMLRDHSSSGPTSPVKSESISPDPTSPQHIYASSPMFSAKTPDLKKSGYLFNK